jgi:WhiB family redox-sensing transcriptional regulator
MPLDDGWMVLAACRRYPDPDPIFFPPKYKGVRTDISRAKHICFNECEVRKTCLVYAIAHRESQGVWGGLGEVERRRLPKAVKLLYRQTWFQLHPQSHRQVSAL